MMMRSSRLLTHRKPPEPHLAFDETQPARDPGRETRAFYAAVMKLRRAGFRVYREGGMHRVNGALISAPDVRAVARKVKPAPLAKQALADYG